jgi:antirestriction protein ArdC
LHELAHWTGHSSRLNRIITTKVRFGSDDYAMEELIAELTAAFLCAELGVSSSPRQDHANYIASWLKVLKNDTKAIFYAARQAAVAAEYIKAQQVQ